ncbi:hypothetical protein [Candidatus Accumulibacter vicinus]|uniref:hypothetical protein n=1 Tax=Candidatus Accumulibacter vicinus TaxID=2954382 RepID=UPI00235B658B|nr:hypothetical protein [Candidatus Accumulibacter vicinus]
MFGLSRPRTQPGDASHDSAGDRPLYAGAEDPFSERLVFREVLPGGFLHGLRKFLRRFHRCAPGNTREELGSRPRSAPGHRRLQVVEPEFARQVSSPGTDRPRSQSRSKGGQCRFSGINSICRLVHLLPGSDRSLADTAGQPRRHFAGDRHPFADGAPGSHPRYALYDLHQGSAGVFENGLSGAPQIGVPPRLWEIIEITQ